MDTKSQLLCVVVLAVVVAACTAGNGAKTTRTKPGESGSLGVREIDASGDSDNTAQDPISTIEEENVALEDRVADQLGANYEIIGVDSGAVLGGMTSPILLLNNKQLRVGEGDELDLHAVVVYDEQNKELVDVGFWTFRLNPSAEAHASHKTYLDVAKSVSEVFGTWNGYFFVHDHNANGREEIIGMRLSGMDFLPAIYEYHEGSFRSVVPDMAGRVTLALEAPAPGTIVVYEPDYEERKPQQFCRSRLVWSAESRSYELDDEEMVAEYPVP